MILPLLGERAGVRVSLCSIFIQVRLFTSAATETDIVEHSHSSVGECDRDQSAVKKIIHAPAAISSVESRHGIGARLINVPESAARNQRAEARGDNNIVREQRTILEADA